MKMDGDIPIVSFIDESKKEKTNFVDMLVLWDCMTTVMIDSLDDFRGEDMGMKEKLTAAKETVMQGLGISTRD